MAFGLQHLKRRFFSRSRERKRQFTAPEVYAGLTRRERDQMDCDQMIRRLVLRLGFIRSQFPRNERFDELYSEMRTLVGSTKLREDQQWQFWLDLAEAAKSDAVDRAKSVAAILNRDRRAPFVFLRPDLLSSYRTLIELLVDELVKETGGSNSRYGSELASALKTQPSYEAAYDAFVSWIIEVETQKRKSQW